MEVNKQELIDFLRENGCKDATGAILPLDPLFSIAEKGEYPLFPQNEINDDELIKDVTLATGRHISKVIFISLSDPLQKPELMTQDFFQSSLGYSLGHSLVDIFRNKINGNLINGNLVRSLGYSLGHSLVDSLEHSLQYSLEHSLLVGFKDNVWCSPWDNLNHNLWQSLYLSLFYYLCFSLLNDQEKIKTLKPLVGFWDKCWILGFKEDELETLLVICR